MSTEPNFQKYRVDPRRRRAGWSSSKETFIDKGYIKLIKEKVRVTKTMSKNDFDFSSAFSTNTAGPDRLIALGFDPMSELVEQLAEINLLIAEERAKDKPRDSILRDLQSIKLKLVEILLPYRYGKAPSVAMDSDVLRAPINIILTKKE